MNFRMPAEWEMQEAIWLSWPKNRQTFAEEIIGKVEETFVKITKEITSDQKVKILVDDKTQEKRVNEMLIKNGVTKNVIFHNIKSSDVWIRDYGPTFVKKQDGKIAAVKWTYNAYGNKYDDLAYDDQAGGEVVKASGKEKIDSGIILEGGSIEVNGKGTLITTEQCLLNQNRNSKLSRSEIENKLKECLGITHIIWLGDGVKGDDTDGHIDDIARFVDENTIVCAYEENTKDDNYQALKNDYETLSKSKDQDGKQLRVIRLPMPKEISNEHGRLPASYANFLITNKKVLLPIFNDPINDKKAIEILSKAMPNRKIIIAALKGKPDEKPQQPDSVVQIDVDGLMGGKPKEGGPVRKEFFVKGTEPSNISSAYQRQRVCKNNIHRIANDGQDAEDKDVIMLKEDDPTGANKWQAGIDTWVLTASNPQFVGVAKGCDNIPGFSAPGSGGGSGGPISIANIPNGANVPRVFDVLAIANSPAGVKQVVWTIDGATKNKQTAEPFAQHVEFPNGDRGTHTITVELEDNNGQKHTSSISVTVNM
jgi:agmatine deiminase